MTAKEKHMCHKCCDTIIRVESVQEGMLKDVEDLKKLYEPVQKIKIIFTIVGLVILILLGLNGFLWRDLYGIRRDLFDYNQNIMQEFYNINLKLSEFKLKNTELELDFLKFQSDSYDKKKRPNR